jgi:4-hydroxy-tetrahydrodipicolinate reductase
MTRIIIAGAKGRMGQTLIGCAARIPNLQVTGQVDVGDAIEPMLEDADVVIDFSFHDATAQIAQACSRQSKALIIGTTGHDETEKAAILNCTRSIPIVWASNYSTGVNTLFWLARKAAEILGPSYDLEVVEMHHRLKKDAPSGTAMTLAEILADARKQQLAEVIQHGREGIVGARAQSEIGMHSIRGGDVIGDHTVIYATNGERVELTHKASGREAFANGALHAAQWVIGKPVGLYSMQDVLGLK